MSDNLMPEDTNISISERVCVDCGRSWPLDRFRADNPNPDSCFRCRTMGVSLSVQGGKDYWKSDTEDNRRRIALKEAKDAGFDPVPVHSKGWGGVSASTMSKIGDVSKKNGAWGKPTTPNTSSAGALGSN